MTFTKRISQRDLLGLFYQVRHAIRMFFVIVFPAFLLQLPTDKTVYPMPTRELAFYGDNTTTPYSVLVDGFDAIADNTFKPG